MLINKSKRILMVKNKTVSKSQSSTTRNRVVRGDCSCISVECQESGHGIFLSYKEHDKVDI